MKKSLLITLLLALCLVFALSASAMATDAPDDENAAGSFEAYSDTEANAARYSLIFAISANISITNDIAYLDSEVQTQEKVAKIYIAMNLQKYTNGQWRLYAAWARTKEDTDYFYLLENTSVDKGSFRNHTVGTVTAYDGERETATATSGVSQNP